jgi:pantoate--beta-alanine ligase
MTRIHTPEEWINIAQSLNKPDTHKTIGLVPTMGALHEGHRSLVLRSVQENDYTIVSIFVNPVQFNNKQDLASYPVSLEADCSLLENAGADFVFIPDYHSLYPDNYQYRLSESSVSKILCGASRPGHFDGVLTVVMKLLLLFQPQFAYFGEKDYQQYQLIAGMAESFFLRTKIVACPIIRDQSGLALSSRNKRLSPQGLTRAPLFHAALASRQSPEQIRSQLEKEGFLIDYITEYDGRLYGAVFLEEVRLIDNVPCNF